MSAVRVLRVACALLLSFTTLGCLGPRGDSAAEKRTHVRQMRDETVLT